jgi:hypothetical protein
MTRQAIISSLAMIILLLALGGCSGQSRSDRAGGPLQTIASPSGDRVLVITVNSSRDDPTKYLTLIFEVRDVATQTSLHRQQTSASSRMAWSMRWLDDAAVQLSSSDVGTICWQEQPDGAWLEAPCP